MSTKRVIDTETGEISGRVVENDRAYENSDFVMLYRKFIYQVSELGMKDAKALQVFLFLVRHMSTTNALICNMELMSKVLHLSRQTISAKIKKLQEDGWIYVLKSARFNVYVINPDVCWTSYASDKKYCEFPATVMLDYDDCWDLPHKSKKSIRHVDIDVLKSYVEELELEG